MTKRLVILTIVLALLMMPVASFAKGFHEFGVAKAIAKGGNTLIVPLEITNEANLTALDIPLEFSEGVELKKVDFENTRISYFDFTIANINNENRTVIIGALPQMSAASKGDLKAGSGVIANLVFEITDPSVSEVTIKAIEMEDPYHRLMFVYHSYGDDGQMQLYSEMPAFASVTVPTADANLPQTFSLNQNYPNPFNPTTDMEFALPVAGHVNLTIYNVLGQEVTALVDEHYEAGVHTVQWDAGRYSSGVYFYRLTTDSFSDTKKMVLLK